MNTDIININLIEAEKLFINSDFDSEKELSNFFEKHINQICSLIFNSGVKSYEKEYPIRIEFEQKSLTTDYKIELKNNESVILECKNPTQNLREGILSIGQMLGYISAFRLYENKANIHFCILTTRFNILIVRIIMDFQLPIKLIFINKNNVCVFDNKKI